MPRETVDGNAPAHMSALPAGREPQRPPEVSLEEAERRKIAYLTRIGRLDLAPILTEERPIAIFSMESYRHDTPAQGGLGMVVGDWSYIYRRLGIPVAIVANFYNVEVHQRLVNLWQVEDHVPVHPEDRGFSQIDGIDVRLSSRTHPMFKVPIYEKREDNVRNIDPYHPDIKDVYNGKTNSGHRLFQEVVEGFGGHQALAQLGLTPPLYIMNEAPVVFSPIAELDSLVDRGMGFDAAMERVREKTVYVNHTLVPAAELPFQWWQFNELVYPNIKSNQVINWMDSRFRNGEINLSTLALDVSARRRGVSMPHAEEASKVFFDFGGKRVDFKAITNGISMNRWAHPQLLGVHQESRTVDEFELPGEDALEKIMGLPEERLRAAKEAAKTDFREALKDMVDQNGDPVVLPEGVKIIGSARRAADYKRIGFPFTDPDRLAQILEEQDAHFFISGKAHSSDNDMKAEIRRVCEIINNHPILKKRAHYIQDYREDVSKPLIRAADMWLNYPVVRDDKTWAPKTSEADGTSKDKAILNLAIIVSTEDGGMKDAAMIEEAGGTVIPGDHAPYYLKIDSTTREGEIDSFYSQLTRGLQIVEGNDPEYTWGRFVTRQLASDWSTISGGRWVAEELDFALPKDSMLPGKLYPLQAAS